MLSKEICKRCISEHSRTPWDDRDESDWQDAGILACDKRDEVDLLVSGEPPPDCFYLLEQTVLGQTCIDGVKDRQ